MSCLYGAALFTNGYKELRSNPLQERRERIFLYTELRLGRLETASAIAK